MAPGAPQPATHVVLDTDLGTDVDDVLALSALLGDPGVTLHAITTAYGDTALRARMARRVCELAGRPEVPVVAGAGEPLSDVEVWWPGHEGVGVPGIDDVVLEEGGADAADTLARLAAERPGELDVIAIAPLTNVATAIVRHPRFVRDVRHLWIMGGCFALLPPDPETGRAGEHNWASDPLAAWIVMRSGVAATICGLDMTLRVALGPDVAARLRAAGAFGELLFGQLERWWAVSGRGEGDYPHDAITVLAARAPELFVCEPVAVDVVGEGELGGVSTAVADPASPVRVVRDYDAGVVLDGVTAALLRCCVQAERATARRGA